MAPGTVARGTVARGTVAPGTVAPGTVGTRHHGTRHRGHAAPWARGTVAPVQCCPMLTRILVVTSAVLLAVVAHQYNTIGELRAEVAGAQAKSITDARALTADSLEGYDAELQRTMIWLEQIYREPDGLGRPQGLWIDGHPDYQGLTVWVFDVYLRRRLKGDAEAQARDAIAAAIRQSDEFRRKHKPPQG